MHYQYKQMLYQNVLNLLHSDIQKECHNEMTYDDNRNKLILNLCFYR